MISNVMRHRRQAKGEEEVYRANALVVIGADNDF